MDNTPIGDPAFDNKHNRQRLLTLAEAASRLRICTKSLAAFLRDHPCVPPLFAQFGRQYLISEADLQRIYEEMKICRSGSSGAEDRHTITSAAPSEASTFTKLRALTTPKRPKSSASSAKANS
jgi:hypothetical protein